MHTPIHVLDAHVRAVNENRLQQARHAELIRFARGNRPTATRRFVAMLRTVTGGTLISLGQRLQREPAAQATRELEAMSVTRTQRLAS